VDTRLAPSPAFIENRNTQGWRASHPVRPGDKLRVDGHIQADASDQNHCNICWKRVSFDHEPHAYRRGNN